MSDDSRRKRRQKVGSSSLIPQKRKPRKGKTTEEGKVIPLDVKTGDKILFGKYSGTEIKVEGEELLIMREEDILGIIEGK